MSTVDLSELLHAPISFDIYKGSDNSSALLTVSNKEGATSLLITPVGMALVNPDSFVEKPKERKESIISRRVRFFKATARGAAWFSISVMATFILMSAAGIIQLKVVLTDSMSPTIKPGDITISVSPSRKFPNIGDVAVYQGRRFDGTKVAEFAHRIVGGDASQGFVMRGDHNPSDDVQRPTLRDITGVVIFVIPFIGKLLAPQMILIFILAAFGIWLIVDAFRDEE